jgi:hypothetical protein
MFEHRVLKEVYVSMREVKETGENCTVRSYIICTPKQILLGWLAGGGCNIHMKEMNTRFW